MFVIKIRNRQGLFTRAFYIMINDRSVIGNMAYCLPQVGVVSEV